MLQAAGSFASRRKYLLHAMGITLYIQREQHNIQTKGASEETICVLIWPEKSLDTEKRFVHHALLACGVNTNQWQEMTVSNAKDATSTAIVWLVLGKEAMDALQHQLGCEQVDNLPVCLLPELSHLRQASGKKALWQSLRPVRLARMAA